MMSFVPWRSFVCAALVFWTSACAFVVDDDAPNEEETIEWGSSLEENYPNSSTYTYAQCKSVNKPSSICGQRLGLSGPRPDTSYAWNSNCRGRDCQVLSLFVHYVLNENLGTAQTLRVEAFDNPRFTGSPAASLEIAGFDASRPQSSDREEIFLAPGEYYFRAFLSQAGLPSVPYALNGMELVGETPLGVYGALSGARRVIVTPDRTPDPIHITIDQLFKKPGSEPDSRARVRIKFEVDEGATIPTDRDVRIQVLSSADIEQMPLYSYTISSRLLLTPGREFATEFVTPSLKPGAYYIFSYIDADSNGYYDLGELGALYSEGDEPTAVQVDKDATRTIYLVLKEVL
jgi:hypothetical protein